MVKKSFTIFSFFYNIYGVGKSMLNKYYSFAGVNLKTFPKNIKKKHQKKIFKKLKLQKSGKVLKKYNSGRLQFFLEIKS